MGQANLPGSDLLNNPLLNPGQKPAPKPPPPAPAKPTMGGNKPKPAKAAVEEDEPEIQAPPPVKPKAEPKVKLHDLEWSSEGGFFNDKITISVQADLPPDLENITRIEFKVMALTPDGKKEQVDKQDAHLKNGTAAKEVTLFIPRFKKDGHSLSECDFIFTAKHRDSKEEESDPVPVKQHFATHVHWQKEEEWIGYPVKLLADTTLADGEEVDVKVTSVVYQTVAAKVKAKGGKLELAWTPCMCGIVTGADGQLPAKEEYFAEFIHDGEVAAPKKNLHVKLDAHSDYQHFSHEYSWSGYSTHSEFKQRIDKGALDLQVKKVIIKAWAGWTVNMKSGGIKGTAGGCPYDGYRWGRIIGAGSGPNEYYDGKAWVPFPAAYVPTDLDFNVVGFVKGGSKFHIADEPTGIWPEKFTDYDFDSAANTQKRKDWVADTETRWSRKFVVRPKACAKGDATGGCGYPLDMKLEMKTVTHWSANTITVCDGNFRSNSACFSLGDPDIEMVAHETGHLVGNPDEYAGGGIDPKVNGDGAVNGVDTTSVMGQTMQLVKKRHYVNFVAVTQKQVTNKAGKKVEFIAADI